MADVNMKVGDILPKLTVICQDNDKAAVDLTDATSVKFIMRNNGTVKVNATANFVSPRTSGKVEYVWAAADVDTAGSYEGEFEVTWGSAKETFPNDGYLEIHFHSDLA